MARGSPVYSPLAANQLITLRALGLVLQLVLTFFGADAFGLSLQQSALVYIFGLELLFLGLTLKLRHALVLSAPGLFLSLLIDTLLWISWLYFSGGATNAFISLLLLPIAIAAVTLPFWAPWTLAAITTLAYSLMLYAVPAMEGGHHEHAGHMAGGSMASHYVGMWFNFLLSALVLTTSVALIARRLRQTDAELAALRESQLRQEQLIALGTASAQMSHQLATPLASLRLLLDEVAEGDTEPGLVAEMDLALTRCETSLNSLREATEAIRERKLTVVSAGQLLHLLKQQVLLLMPDVVMDISLSDEVAGARLSTDVSLLPSLLALVDNGAKASKKHGGEARVWLSARLVNEACIRLDIRDAGPGIDAQKLTALGARPVLSEQGLGMALMLSHASLERLGGELHLGNLPEGGCLASVRLPLEQSS
ncbi:sensor histidine kinase KdpD [Shewanella amazonensis]|uniref:histidine kinase n=1 Tax=Shewanella amazonensis (strain ATCC BAA-1098 / SB2B) TaxID=326297 RepID=A1SAI3_SHEAM|nr:ATP-binding protein [Shewanella amazonensis]ABM01390.1 sensor histidine kinase [Shewanella amazonensis SB2B]